MNAKNSTSALVAVVACLLTACGPGLPAPEEAEAIAKEAYVYGLPMVLGYKTMYNWVIDESSPEYKGSFNQLACVARLFTPDDRAMVTPNADTPYCMTWMDLRAEPIVLTVPEIEPERFYHFQLVDLYTHNFAYVGTLTTGNGAGTYLIAGPSWNGEKPEGISDVLRSETEFIFNMTRTQLFGPEDLARLTEIQGSYGLQPLSAFLGTEAPAAELVPDFPTWHEGSQFDERSFGYLDFMMSLLGGPGQGEEALWERLARLGIGPGSVFDFAALPGEIQNALRAGVESGFDEIEDIVVSTANDPLVSAKVFGTREFLLESSRENFGHENQHLIRAAAAHMGIYGNSGSEAIYPIYVVDLEGQPYDASTNRYTLTFEEGQLPPVNAFWSLTMYDGATQLFITNPLDRYLLNSGMLEQFRREDDGSLVLYVHRDSPGPDRESNWLPAPDGPFYMLIRLYGPEASVLQGEWTPPPAIKIQ
jgi:hypothetical protein